MRTGGLVVAVLLGWSWVASAQPALEAAPAYYAIVWAQQDGANHPPNSHTFVTFAKVAADGSTIEERTISWMPATGIVRTLARRETGRNVPLGESLETAKKFGLYYFGPYEIAGELYDRSGETLEELEGGGVAYKAIDLLTHRRGAINCVRAASMPGGKARTGTVWGLAGSRVVARHLSTWFVDPTHRHPWLLERLSAPVPGEAVAQSLSGETDVATPH